MAVCHCGDYHNNNSNSGQRLVPSGEPETIGYPMGLRGFCLFGPLVASPSGDFANQGGGKKKVKAVFRL